MKHVANLLAFLGYDESPACLRPRDEAFLRAPRIGHILRKAADDLSLEAVYTLHPKPATETVRAPVPAVYVCSAKDEKSADELHRLIWNQDIAPFVVLSSPGGIKLYSGFRHRRKERGGVEGQLSGFTSLDDAAEVLRHLDAQSIDNGSLWHARQQEVYWRHRLNLRLLENLLRVDECLQKKGLEQETAHALIGKYVYLRYLRDREILSDRKLDRWGIPPDAVFGRNAKISALEELGKQLDHWLNGSVFPLKFSGKSAPKARHVRLVSGIFEGDDVMEGGDVQLSLDFQDYDFSHIPIETLSLVYEQFLHRGKPGVARVKGAYYTPIPVVNLMLSELEETRPLRRGMKVIDPSCGSGAFLVQAYRQLIEREFPPGSDPRPGDLRELLERHIFGIDIDPDACNVTELSLILTLLDYLKAPDLEDRRRGFKLPTLRNQNIFHANFFGELPEEFERQAAGGFDWVVGNPPWKQLNERSQTEEDRPVLEWIAAAEKSGMPVGGNQSARAFVWKSAELLGKDGKVALFIPSMSLHDNPARKFRKRFFSRYRVFTVADLSNLAEVVSNGRFRVPGAAIFFGNGEDETAPAADSTIAYYAPMVANQELTRPDKPGQRVATWDLVVNGSEIRQVPEDKALSGDALVWKIAMWGSHLDERLLRRLGRCFPSLGWLEDSNAIVVKQGPQLEPVLIPASETYPTEYCRELVGKKRLNTKSLAGMRHVFKLPEGATMPNADHFIDLRAGKSKLEVCRPPHVIVSAARNYAVFLDEFLIVPPRQIGITSPTDDRDFLKVLSLYLNSDFVLYHQFFTSSQFGVQRARSTLKSLRKLPVPIGNLSASEMKEWVRLHERLVSAEPASSKKLPDLFDAPESLADTGEPLLPLLDELNERTADLLGLTKTEQALVHDMLHVRLGLRDGKVEECATGAPSKEELRSYAQVLKANLDGFLGKGASHSHGVTVVPTESSGLVAVDFVGRPRRTSAKVEPAGSATAASLDRLSRRLLKARSQWVYFNRNFRIYEKNRTFVLKPMQRFHWTRTQAALDAQSIVAETLIDHHG